MGSWRRAAWVGVAVWGLVTMAGAPAGAERWRRADINALLDEAFASVEVWPDGTRVRHLPHHDARGRVDLPHLRSAMSRFHQVQWVDPANAERARQHLVDHFRALGLPVPGEVRAYGSPPPRPRAHRHGRHTPRVPAAPKHVIQGPGAAR